MTHPHVTAPPVALNRYAIRLAGHQSPRQVSYAGWDRLAESLAESGGIRALARVVVRDGTALLMFGFQHKHINNIVEF